MASGPLKRELSRTDFGRLFLKTRAPYATIPFDRLAPPDDPRRIMAKTGLFTPEDVARDLHATVDAHTRIVTKPEDAPLCSLPPVMLAKADSCDRRLRESGRYCLAYRGLDGKEHPVFMFADFDKVPVKPYPVVNVPSGLADDLSDDMDADVWRDLLLFELAVNGRVIIPDVLEDEEGRSRGMDARVIAKRFLSPTVADAAFRFRTTLILLAIRHPDEAEDMVLRLEEGIRGELAEYGLALDRTRSYAPVADLAGVPRWILGPMVDDPSGRGLLTGINDANRRFEDQCWARVLMASDLHESVDVTIPPSHPDTNAALKEWSSFMKEIAPDGRLTLHPVGARKRDGRIVFLIGEGDHFMPDRVNGVGLGDHTDDR